jgi:hypothetical protein
LQLAVCSWQFAVGSLQFTVCSWQLAVGSWQFTVCSWQLAVGSFQFGVFSLEFSVWSLLGAKRRLRRRPPGPGRGRHAWRHVVRPILQRAERQSLPPPIFASGAELQAVSKQNLVGSDFDTLLPSGYSSTLQRHARRWLHELLLPVLRLVPWLQPPVTGAERIIRKVKVLVRD